MFSIQIHFERSVQWTSLLRVRSHQELPGLSVAVHLLCVLKHADGPGPHGAHEALGVGQDGGDPAALAAGGGGPGARAAGGGGPARGSGGSLRSGFSWRLVVSVSVPGRTDSAL